MQKLGAIEISKHPLKILYFRRCHLQQITNVFIYNFTGYQAPGTMLLASGYPAENDVFLL